MKIRAEIYQKYIFDTHNYLFHNDKGIRKTMRIKNRKIFKSNFYIYT